VAIGYIEARIVSAGRGESVVGLSYYVCRADGTNPVDDRTYRFAKDIEDCASVDVLLPPGAPLAYRDPAQFCAAMEWRETTIDRKTGLPRFKTNAQVAKHIVLALPKELTLAEQRRLACDWAGSRYVKHGVGAIVAVHHPDDPATGNAHAHIILSTRLVKPTGLGKKARHLNPAFTRSERHTRATLHGEDLPGQWAAFQDAWFRKHGIELRVDPFQRRGGVHLGRARYLPETDAEAANKAAFEESKKLIQDPAEALSALTRRKATFSPREIAGLFRRYKFTKDEIRQLTDRVLAHPDLVRLHDPETGMPLPRFTTRQVRAQERRILDAAEALLATEPDHDRKNAFAAATQSKIAAMGLAAEQAAGLCHLVDGPNLRLLRGIAGAGKSYTIRAVREVLEAGGFRVIGLAPTNTVTCAMAVDGFGEASTVDLELIRQEAGRFGTEPCDSDTCLIIDEAAMLDAGRYERILVRAAAAGARVILVGDEKQLASVERGGIFDELKARYGCAELLDVRRQDEGWAKAASRNFAAGRIREGIEAYASHGNLHWSDGLDEAMAALVASWGADVRRDPAGSRFVYAATNKTVDALNAALQNERWRAQQVAFERFETRRGDSTLRIDLVVGDRIQLHGTDRKLGLYNGIVGTVTFASQDNIQFTTDDGRQLEFDPRTYDTWALGYAGTAYRGQGKTQTQVYALYDHQLAWHARTKPGKSPQVRNASDELFFSDVAGFMDRRCHHQVPLASPVLPDRGQEQHLEYFARFIARPLFN
jgi:Ti-type conjugative transfer relaxase TraA